MNYRVIVLIDASNDKVVNNLEGPGKNVESLSENRLLPSNVGWSSNLPSHH